MKSSTLIALLASGVLAAPAPNIISGKTPPTRFHPHIPRDGNRPRQLGSGAGDPVPSSDGYAGQISDGGGSYGPASTQGPGYAGPASDGGGSYGSASTQAPGYAGPASDGGGSYGPASTQASGSSGESLDSVGSTGQVGGGIGSLTPRGDLGFNLPGDLVGQLSSALGNTRPEPTSIPDPDLKGPLFSTLTSAVTSAEPTPTSIQHPEIEPTIIPDPEPTSTPTRGRKPATRISVPPGSGGPVPTSMRGHDPLTSLLSSLTSRLSTAPYPTFGPPNPTVNPTGAPPPSGTAPPISIPTDAPSPSNSVPVVIPPSGTDIIPTLTIPAGPPITTRTAHTVPPPSGTGAMPPAPTGTGGAGTAPPGFDAWKAGMEAWRAQMNAAITDPAERKAMNDQVDALEREASRSRKRVERVPFAPDFFEDRDVPQPYTVYGR